MIPNSQFWFNNASSGFPPIETGYEYVATGVNYSPAITERDGTVIFETGGKLRAIGGWNPALFPPFDTTNQQWESVDGSTWVQIADAPWTGRHNFAHGFRANGDFWLWGGDTNTIPTGQRDVWKCVAGTWSQVTADWGNVAGDRGGHSFCVHNDYMYLIGGSIQDCVRSNDGINWTKMSDLPSFGAATYDSGYACSHRGYIYILGGDGTASSGNQYKVYRTATGATWEALPDLPAGTANTTYWCRVFSWADRLWYFQGTGSSGNTRGIWMSDDDGQTWNKHYSFFMRPTHATGVGTFGNDLYGQVTGNSNDDINKLYRVAYAPLTNRMVHSVRKAVVGYSGYCMEVRRSSDNTTRNIGFVGDDLDIADLASFVGANDGFIRTWYDQTGSGTHLIQTNNLLQPLIRTGGTTYTQNGKPAIYFDTNAKYLNYSSTINIASKYTISAVMNLPSGLRQFGYGGSNSYLFYNNTSGSSVGHNNGITPTFATFTSGFVFSNGSQKLVEVYRNRNTSWVYENGVMYEMLGDNNYVAISNTRTRFDTDQTIIQIGGELGGQSFSGYLQELNIKTGVVEADSNIAIQTDINGRFNVYP